MNEQLLTALVAAGAALLGAAVGQFGPVVQQWLSARRERRNVLRERYEQVAMLFADAYAELDHLFTNSAEIVLSKGRSLSLETRPAVHAASRMYSLVLVYFPELLPATKSFSHGVDCLTQALKQPFETERLEQAANEAGAARKLLEAAIQQHAYRYR